MVDGKFFTLAYLAVTCLSVPRVGAEVSERYFRGNKESVLRAILQNYLWYLLVGRGDVAVLRLDVRVGVRRTIVLEIFNLIKAKRHQAMEK